MAYARQRARKKNPVTQGLAQLRRLGDRGFVVASGAAQAVGPVNHFKYSKDLTQHAVYAAQNGGTFPAPDTVNCTATYNSGFRFEVSTNTDAFIAPAVGKYTIAIDIAAGTLSSIYIGLDPGNSTATSNAPGLVALTADYQTIAVNVDVTVAGTVFRIFVLNQTGVAGTFKVRGMGLFLGTYTASELLALGGIPTTTTSPAAARYTSWINGAALAPDTPSRAVGPVNLRTYSQDFTNAVYTKPDVTFGAISTIAGLSFVKFVENAGTGKQPILQETISVPTGQNTRAVVVAAGGRNFARIALINSASVTDFVNLYLNLTTGAVTAGSTGGTPPAYSSSVVDLGGAWLWAISYTATTTTNQVWLGGVVAANDISFNTDGVSGLNVHRVGHFQGAYTAAQLQATGGVPLTTTVPLPNYDGSGVALGPNLITAAGWSTTPGVTNNSGTLTLSGATTTLAAQQAGVKAGVTYLVTGTVSGLTAGSLSLTLEGGTATTPTLSANGSFSSVLTATATGLLFVYLRSTPVTAVVSNIGLQEITTMPQAPWLMNYVESTMNTAAAVDGPVGALTDGSATVGAQMIANSAFSSVTGWTTGTGWSIAANALTGAATTGTAYNFANQLTLGALYQITYRVSSVSAGSVRVAAGYGSVGLTRAAPGTYTELLFCSGDTQLYVQAVAAFTGSVTLVECRPVTGRHATQATGSAKPVLRRGLVNTITSSGDLTATNWTKAAVNLIAGIADPYGGTSAQKFFATTAAGAEHSVINGQRLAVGVQTFAVIAQAAGYNFLNMRTTLDGVGYKNACFDLTTGAAVGGGTLGVQSSLNIGGGWWLLVCQATRTAGDQTLTLGLLNAAAAGDNTPSFTGDGASGVNFYRAAVFAGTLTAQQILALGGIPLTLNVPACSAAGNYALEFDGAKFMTLGGVPFTATDDHAVVIGARVDDVSAVRTIYSHSNASNHQLPWVRFDTAGKINVTWWDGVTAITLTSPLSYVGVAIVVSVRRAGTTGVLRVNGVTVASGSLAALSSSTLTTATIGAFSGGSLSLLHKGLIYSVNAIKASMTDAEMLVQERFAAAMTGPIPNYLRF